MDERHITYNNMTKDIKEREKAGTLFVIRPPEALGIHRTEKNPDELERVYQIGRNEALKHLNELKDYLDKSREVLLKDENDPALFININGQRLTRQGFWKIIKYYCKEKNGSS